MKELVSCIVPSYNRAHLLKEAIESTLSQSYPNWELIIVDDRSTDNTAEVVAGYQRKDPRIKYYLNPEKGVSSARNYGARMAQGDFLAFLDDDDVHLQHRFESQLKAMLNSGSRFLVSGYRGQIRPSDKIVVEKKLELKGICAGFPSRWMIGKELFQVTGGFDQKFAPLEDIELSIRISLHETFALHDDIVSTIFGTRDSASNAIDKMVLARRLLLESAINVLSREEAAWWEYSVATDYYRTGKNKEAKEYLMKAAKADARGIYGIAYQYFKLAGNWSGPFKRLNFKILSWIREFRPHALVNHPIVINK